jgi:hypothetical protein
MYYKSYHLPSLVNSREQILAILIYYKLSDIREKSFGKHTKVYLGKALLREIL